MAITDAYADSTRYRAIVGHTSGDNDSEIDSALLGVSRYLDRRLGRFFTKDAAAVIRYSYPDRDAVGDPGRPHVLIELYPDDSDMAAAPTLIRIDEDRDGTYEKTLVSTDYELVPRNAPRGPEPRPYRGIRLLPSGTYTAWMPGSLVEVTAVWGWPAVPEAIVQATCQLTAILRLESPRATSQINAGFDTVLGTSNEAQEIVRRLQSVYAHNRVFA